MKEYFVFDTEAEAQLAVAAINTVMGLPNAATLTERWDIPLQRLDGKWVTQVPLVATDVVADKETYSESWFSITS